MTVEEIFTTLASHMETGIKLHRDFVKVYNFLFLKGFKKCQYYHFLEETQNYYGLCHYYMDHYHKMLNNNQTGEVKVIDIAWYKYTQFEVDTNTKRNTIKNMIEQWIKWEKSTKELLQRLYQELCGLNEIAAAKEFEIYLQDVNNEIKEAEKQQLKLQAIDYDIGLIMDEQAHIYNKYSKKIKNLFNE